MKMGWLLVVLTVFGVGFTLPQAQAQGPDRVENARRLFEEGVQAYNRGDLRQALTKMREAHREFRRPEFAYNIARVLERMGEAGHAISWFEVYLRHGRPSPEERADIEARVGTLREYQQRVAGQAAQAPSSEDINEEARRFFENGVSMFARRQYLPAMQAFQYVERVHRFPELYFNLGLTAEHLERWEEAALYYRRFLQSRPNAPGRDEVEAKVEDLQRRARARR